MKKQLNEKEMEDKIKYIKEKYSNDIGKIDYRIGLLKKGHYYEPKLGKNHKADGSISTNMKKLENEIYSLLLKVILDVEPLDELGLLIQENSTKIFNEY